MDQLTTLQGAFGPILAIKLYRLDAPSLTAVPVIPCLDHEAMLHQTAPAHAAAYVQDRSSGDLHEVVLVPSKQQIEVDTVSTWGESSSESHKRLLNLLHERFGSHRIRAIGPSWWRGDRRVADACRAQVTLREVLLGDDLAAISRRIDRLKTVGTLMEKQSRVASWGVRTVTGPLLAAAGVLTYGMLGSLSGRLGTDGVAVLRYALVGLLGAVFLYYGLKAVHLTAMANRVWKRSAEYGLILAERERLRTIS